MKKYAIILAAGKGTRMLSDIPKCLNDFFGKTIIERIVDACYENNFDEIIVVVGYKSEMIYHVLENKVKYIKQEEQLGTAHAIMCCKEYFENKNGLCVIIPGDMPLINGRTIFKLMKVHNMIKANLTLVSTLIDYENNYGRIYRVDSVIKKIIEYKNASEEEKKIKEVNSGLYCVNIKELFDEINNIQKNKLSNEYYFTDLIEIFEKKYKVGCYFIKDSAILMGVNTVEELEEAKKIFKKREQ